MTARHQRDVEPDGADAVLGPTKMACELPAMAVEQAMGTVLSGTIAYQIEAGVLTLRTPIGGLTFRPPPDRGARNGAFVRPGRPGPRTSP